MNGVFGSLQYALQIDSFCQERSLREVVSDQNDWDDECKDAADNNPSTGQFNYHSAFAVAPPNRPAKNGCPSKRKANKIERKLHQAA